MLLHLMQRDVKFGAALKGGCAFDWGVTAPEAARWMTIHDGQNKEECKKNGKLENIIM